MARIDLGKVVGDSATISVGNVTTLEAGQNATVVNTGTELNGVFDFGIPKGPKGDKGDTGSQGPVGPQGVQGKPFTIDKTYSSVLDMQADFNNMEVGSYVMIASNVESEDNARLYYRDTNEWKFISDFSGATGIQGEQGPQGQAGYTPVKGVDYFTSADIAEIEDDIKEITGELANLDTTDKTNLVSAINEIASSSGGTEGADIFRVTNRNVDLLGLKKGIYILDPNYINVFTANIYYSPLRSGSDSWQVDLSDGRFYVLTDITDNMENGVPVVSYYMQDSGGAQKNIMMTIDSTSSGYAGLKAKDVAKSYQIITTNTVQSIYAKKTFITLPESTVVPTNDNQFTNKKYVDDAVASAGGGSYVAGEGINISNNEISSTMPIYSITNNTQQNPFIIENAKPGIYLFGNAASIYMKGFETALNNSTISLCNGFILITNSQIDKSSNTYQLVGYAWGTKKNDFSNGSLSHFSGTISVYGPNGNVTIGNYSGESSVSITGNTDISGIKTFTKLPESTVVPTNDNQFTNKKYVDDAIAAAIANLQQ